MPTRDELIAEEARARAAVLDSVVEVGRVWDRTTDRDQRQADSLLLDGMRKLVERAKVLKIAEEALAEKRPRRGSYRRARGVVTPVVDELPEVTIRRMRDGGQP